MKRINLIIVFLIVSVVSAMAQIDTININRLEVKSRVATITEHTYTAGLNKAGKIIKRSMTDKTFAIDKENRKSNYSYVFDSLRQETKYVTYYSPGNIEKEKLYNYSNGKIVNTKATYHFSDATPVVEEKFDYNDKGLMCQCKTYRDEGLVFTEVYTYDERNNMVEIQETKWDGSKGSSKKYMRKYEGDKEIYCKEYSVSICEGFSDMTTTMEERRSYSPDGMLISYYVNADNFIVNDTYYIYNENGSVDSLYVLGFVKELLWTEKYKYDELNRVISHYIKHTDGDYKNEEYIYSQNGKTEKIKGKQDGVNCNWTYVYNDKNLITKYTTGNVTYKYVYQYDVKGNWTKIIEYKNNRPILIRERKIAYYN